MRRKNTVEIAGDRRARVSFAIIGAFLLTISGSVVYTLQQRSGGERVINPADDITETESELQTEIQTAAREALENAGEMPVTQVSSDPAGRALAGAGSNQVFSRYVRLRFYLNLERKIANIERAHSHQIDGGNLKIRIGLPRANYTEESLNQAIDRVSLERTDKSEDTPVEKVTAGVGTVPIIVSYNGGEIARKNVQLETTTESAVFDMHEKTEEFEQRLELVERELYGPLYGITYAKGGLERVFGKPLFQEKFFSNIITLLEMKEFSNFLVQDMQRKTFGTTADNSDSAKAAGGCLAYYYTARIVGNAFLGELVPPPDISCILTRRSFTSQQGFSGGKPVGGQITELAEQKGGVTLKKNFGPSEVLNTNHTFERSNIARMAYQNVTGGEFSISETTGGEIDKSELESISEEYEKFGTETRPWQSGEFDGQIEAVIEDIYTVGSTVRDTTQTGDALDPSADHRLLDTGTITVTETDEDERTGIEKTVTIELPVTLEETTETSTVNKSVTFKSTVSVGTKASVGETVEERGIRQPYTQLPNLNFVYLNQPSFADAKDEPVGVISPQDQSVGEIENALEDTLETSNITSKNEFETAIETAVTTHGTIDYTEITTKRQREELKRWLKQQLETTHNQVINNNVEVEADAKQLLTEDSVFSKLAIPEETSRELIYRDVGDRYQTVPVKARSELRKRYIDTINWYINRSQNYQNTAQERIEENMSDGDGSMTLRETLKKSEEAGDFRFSEVDHQQSDSDALYQIDVAPDWFTEKPKTSSKIPQSKPRDEIRQDREPFKHTSLAMRKVTPLPNPGFPIAPFPPFWVISVNYWNTEVRGEYASFSVKPSETELAEADTAYVRQPQPVPLEINGLYRTVGRVEPIGFTATNHIVGVMPGLVPLPKGSLGIGDRLQTPDYFTMCTESWPEPGPGHNDPGLYGIKGGTCPSAGPWGEMIYHGANIGGFKKLRKKGDAKLSDWLRDEKNVWDKYKGKEQTNLPAGKPVWEFPKVDDFIKKLSKGKEPKSELGKELLESVEKMRDLGIDGSVGKLGDTVFATQVGMKAYMKNVLCPMETNDEGRQLGCDDDELTVDVFDGGTEDGDIVVINSQRSLRATDRTLVVDTRPGSLSKSAVPQHIRNGLEKGEVSGAVPLADTSFEPPVNYYVKNTGNGYEMQNENDTTTSIGSLEDNSTMVEATIEVIEPTSDGSTEQPLLYISYTDYSFLVAPGDRSVDWEHVAGQFDDPSRAVDVLITSRAGHDALVDDLSPRSIVLLGQNGDIAADCDFDSHDPTEIYTTENGESVSYRVSEERWLFGPETAPATHC